MPLPKEVVANLNKNFGHLKSVKPVVVHYCITKFDGKRPILALGVRPADATALALQKLWKGDEAVKKSKADTWKVARGAIRVDGGKLSITPATRGSAVVAEAPVRELFKSFKAELSGTGVDATSVDRLLKAPVGRPADTERLLALPDGEEDELSAEEAEAEDFVGSNDAAEAKELGALADDVEKAFVEGLRATAPDGVGKALAAIKQADKELRALRKRLELARVAHARQTGKEAKEAALAYADLVQRADALLDRIDADDDELVTKKADLEKQAKTGGSKDDTKDDTKDGKGGSGQRDVSKEDSSVQRTFQRAREALDGAKTLKTFDRPAVLTEIGKGVAEKATNALAAAQQIANARTKTQLALEALAIAKPTTSDGQVVQGELKDAVAALHKNLARIDDTIERAVALQRELATKSSGKVKDKDTIELVAQAKVLLERTKSQDVTEELASLRTQVKLRREALTRSGLDKVRYADSISALDAVDKKVHAALEDAGTGNARAEQDTRVVKLLDQDAAAIKQVLGLASKVEAFAKDLDSKDAKAKKAATDLHALVRKLTERTEAAVASIGVTESDFAEKAKITLTERRGALRRMRGVLDEAALKLKDPKKLAAQKKIVDEARTLFESVTKTPWAQGEAQEKRFAAFLKERRDDDMYLAYRQLAEVRATSDFLKRRKGLVDWCTRYVARGSSDKLNFDGPLTARWADLAGAEERDKAWTDELSAVARDASEALEHMLTPQAADFRLEFQLQLTGDLLTDVPAAQKVLDRWAELGK